MKQLQDLTTLSCFGGLFVLFIPTVQIYDSMAQYKQGWIQNVTHFFKNLLDVYEERKNMY